MRNTQPKRLDDLCAEWDGVCEKREQVIESGKDISLLSVTAPWLLGSILGESPKTVLDAGCGTGYVSSLVAPHVDSCIGIDASKKSISIARRKYRCPNLDFQVSTIAGFESTQQFDLCLSNMALTSDPLWIESIARIYRLLKPHGALMVMIAHPCFWPRYWGFQNEKWFNYNDEIYIEHDFSISLVKSLGKTTYIHRPLTQYFEGITSAGFQIEKIEEPYPVGPLPEGYSYPYPRFLFLQCRK